MSLFFTVYCLLFICFLISFFLFFFSCFSFFFLFLICCCCCYCCYRHCYDINVSLLWLLYCDQLARFGEMPKTQNNYKKACFTQQTWDEEQGGVYRPRRGLENPSTHPSSLALIHVGEATVIRRPMQGGVRACLGCCRCRPSPGTTE